MYASVAVCDNCEKQHQSKLYPTDIQHYSFGRIPLGWKKIENGSGWKLFCSNECEEKFFQ
jgi:hypothetical protein